MMDKSKLPTGVFKRLLPDSGFTLALIGVMLFSMKSVFVKFCYRAGLDAETITAARYLIALPVYVALGLFAKRTVSFSKMENAPYFLAAMLLGIIGYWLSGYLDFLGLQYIDVQVERMILFTYPLMVVVFGWLLFKQKPSSQMMAAALISYLGLAVIFIQRADESVRFWRGALLVFVSALTFALYQLYAKPVIEKLGVPIATAVIMTGASLASLVTLFTTDRPTAEFSGSSIGLILLLSIAGTLLPSFLMNMALSRISSQANASIGALGPVITLVFAAFFLKEKIGVIDACGMVFVVGGVAWFSLLEARRMKA